jgi:hypothetical protein
LLPSSSSLANVFSTSPINTWNHLGSNPALNVHHQSLNGEPKPENTFGATQPSNDFFKKQIALQFPLLAEKMLKQPSTLNYTCIFCNSLAVIVIVQIHAHHHTQIVTSCSSGLHFGLQAPNIHRLRAPTEPGSPFLTRRSNHQKLQVKLRVESALMLFRYALSSDLFHGNWHFLPF